MAILKVGSGDFVPRLIIFDKDGTLIDFHAMWAGWAAELAGRLEAVTGLALTDRLASAMRFDPTAGQVYGDGPLAHDTLADLHQLTLAVLGSAGLSGDAARAALAAAWQMPDPMRLAQPIADLPELFSALRRGGVKIGIATVDDRAPTEATLEMFNLTALVEAVVCADDGLPIKPAPDMVLSLCQRLGVPPAETAVVGDSVSDLRMGRAAGAGMVVGVLTGIASAEALQAHADWVVPSIRELVNTAG